MDTLATSSNYIVVKDVITFALTVAGLVIAGMGLATWKKQIKGTKDFETAYNVNYAVLKLRAAIKHVRNPAIWPSENQKAVEDTKSKYPNKSEEEIVKNSHSYVYEIRWQKIIYALTELESHLLAAEVLWGSEILKLIRPLNKKVTELNMHLSQNFQTPDHRTKDMMQIHDVIYDKSYEDNEDAFSMEVNTIIQSISTYLKSKMS